MGSGCLLEIHKPHPMVGYLSRKDDWFTSDYIHSHIGLHANTDQYTVEQPCIEFLQKRLVIELRSLCKQCL